MTSEISPSVDGIDKLLHVKSKLMHRMIYKIAYIVAISERLKLQS